MKVGLKNPASQNGCCWLTELAGKFFENMKLQMIFIGQNTKRKLEVLSTSKGYKIPELKHLPCKSILFFFAKGYQDKPCVECQKCGEQFYGKLV